jgi:hypothetical protein
MPWMLKRTFFPGTFRIFDMWVKRSIFQNTDLSAPSFFWLIASIEAVEAPCKVSRVFNMPWILKRTFFPSTFRIFDMQVMHLIYRNTDLCGAEMEQSGVEITTHNVAGPGIGGRWIRWSTHVTDMIISATWLMSAKPRVYGLREECQSSTTKPFSVNRVGDTSRHITHNLVRWLIINSISRFVGICYLLLGLKSETAGVGWAPLCNDAEPREV